MTELEAWNVLNDYAVRADFRIDREMSVTVLRRNFAKAYHPRLADDDNSAMTAINPAIDVVEQEQLRREQAGPGAAEQAAASEPADVPSAGPQPWQADENVATHIYRNDYQDVNFIKKSVYERAIVFGKVELMRAWGWDGHSLRKILSVYANEFALEELGRGLAIWQSAGPGAFPCEAVFVTHEEKNANRLRLIMVRIGRGYEHVASYDFGLDSEPSDPKVRDFLPNWLEIIRRRLNQDRATVR